MDLYIDSGSTFYLQDIRILTWGVNAREICNMVSSMYINKGSLTYMFTVYMQKHTFPLCYFDRGMPGFKACKP